MKLNTGKTKVIRCRKEGGRWKKVSWKWKGKEIEEVKEFKYLEYVIKFNGNQEAQIRDRVKKERQYWGRCGKLGKGYLQETGERGCGYLIGVDSN